MRKWLAGLVILGIGCIAMSFKGSYKKLWKKYEVALEESLPRTSMDILASIMSKAEKDKELGHYFKAYSIYSQLETSLGDLSMKEAILKLEDWLADEQEKESQAILSAILLNQYYEYYTSKLYTIYARTEVESNDSILSNLDLWTKSQYRQRFSSLYHNIFDKSTLLRQKSAKDYQPFVETNTFGKYFDHDLYHVLLWYTLPYFDMIANILELPELSSQKILAQALAHYTANPAAQFLLELELWRQAFTRNNLYWENEDLEQARLADLDKLIAEHEDNEYVVEAISEKVDLLLSKEAKNYLEAAELCTTYLNKFKSYERIQILQNKLIQIKEPFLQLTTAKRVHTNESIVKKISYRNIDDYTLSVYKIDGLVKHPKKSEITEEYLKAQAKLVECIIKEDLYQVDFQLQEESNQELKVQDPGYYILKLESREADEASYETVLVSDVDLIVLQASSTKNTIELIAVDGLSGLPVSDVVVNFYNADDKKLGEVLTDRKGRAVWTAPFAAPWTVRAFYKGVLIEEYATISTTLVPPSSTSAAIKSMSIITDRNIYRPGQKVFVKAYVYQTQDGKTQAVANHKDTLVLYDTFRNEILKREIETNEYGTSSLEFRLPEQLLPGTFTWSSSSRIVPKSSPIQVEEYKRPTYTIQFEPIEGMYKLGDSLVIKGKVESFSGSLLDGVKVKAELVEPRYLEQPFPCDIRFLRLKDERILSDNELELKQGGDFALELLTHKESLGQVQVKITVSSLSGETYSASKYIFMNHEPYQLHIARFDGVAEKSKPMEQLVYAKNKNGVGVDARGVAEISKKVACVDEQEQYKLVRAFDFKANEAFNLDISDLEVGEYRIKYQGEGLTDAASTYAYFTVYSATDNRIPVSTGSWLYLIQDQFDEATPAEFLYGSADEEAYVYLNIYSKEGRVLAQEKVYNKNYHRYVIPYRKEFEEGVRVTFIYLKEHQVVEESFNLKKKEQTAALQMKWITFRDKIKPGSPQKWILQLYNNQQEPVDAEVLAWMYDASLDELTSYRADLSISSLNYRRIPWMYTWNPSTYTAAIYAYMKRQSYHAVKPLVFDVIHTYSSLFDHGRPNLLYSRGPVMADSQVEETVQVESIRGVKEVPSPKQATNKQVVVRSQFDELAFFYPKLRTNSQGNIQIEFTSPEQLSKWRFRALAHKKDLSTASLDQIVYTEKKFAIQAHVPRYMREGDQVKLVSTLKNDENESVDSSVELVLFDPATDKVIFTQQRQLVVSAHSEEKITFELPVLSKIEAIGVKVVATTASFADGEQHILAVLPNVEPLVEGKSIILTNTGESEVSLEDLFNEQSVTATNKELTIELTANPAWFAINPILRVWNTHAENSITYTNQLMACLVANQLRTLYPPVFDQAAEEGIYFKHLAAKEELKHITTEETPWLRQAVDEKQLVAELSKDAIQYLSPASIHALVSKLLDYQNSDGSWVWHKGMDAKDDRLTLEVAEALQALLKSTLLSHPLQLRVERALHSSVQYLYAYYMAQNSKRIGLNQAEWRTILLSQDLKNLSLEAEAMEYKQTVLAKMNTILQQGDLFDKSLALQVAVKTGDHEYAKKLYKSLKEHLIINEQGAHFGGDKFNREYKTTQMMTHIFAMYALHDYMPDEHLLTQMKYWLAMKLRNRAYASGFVLNHALYALTQFGDRHPDTNFELDVQWNDQMISLDKGTPYIYRKVPVEKWINKIELNKRGSLPVWGAVYATFNESLSQVKPRGKEVKVSTAYYLEQTKGAKKVLRPIQNGEPLHIGDILVSRIHFTLDQDLDYVYIQDSRSACLEPVERSSGVRWGLLMHKSMPLTSYVSVRDASTQYFYNSLQKGTYVLENRSYVSRSGTYESGIVSIQSLYAPELNGHSSSQPIVVE